MTTPAESRTRAKPSELEPVFLDGLRAARKITRGPKPERALRELGLKSDLRAEEPTTDGLIATLSSIDLRGRRVGVQLYPGNPNTRFTDFLRQAGAEPDPDGSDGPHAVVKTTSVTTTKTQVYTP